MQTRQRQRRQQPRTLRSMTRLLPQQARAVGLAAMGRQLQQRPPLRLPRSPRRSPAPLLAAPGPVLPLLRRQMSLQAARSRPRRLPLQRSTLPPSLAVRSLLKPLQLRAASLLLLSCPLAERMQCLRHPRGRRLLLLSCLLTRSKQCLRQSSLQCRSHPPQAVPEPGAVV